MRGELVEDVAKLESARSQWDELAIAAGRPYALSGWMLPWWRNASPEGARLRTVLVYDGGDLIGVAPLYEPVPGGRWLRFLASGTSTSVEPVARSGREREVADALARVLAESTEVPIAVAFEGVPHDSPWPDLLRESWPGGKRPAVDDERRTAAPLLDIAGRDHVAWIASQSSKYRKAMRRRRRRLDDVGGRGPILVEPADLANALGAFVELHHARWNSRGGTGALSPGVERMVEELPRTLAPEHLRVWVIEAGGRIVAAEILLAAGGTVSSWLGGFDDAFADCEPSILCLDEAVRDAFVRRERCVDFGPGAQGFKRRWAESEQLLRWAHVIPAGRGAVRTRGVVRAKRLRRFAAERIPDRQKTLLKRVLRRGDR